MKQNLDEIFLAKVVVSNFPDKGWNADYEKLYNGIKPEWNYTIRET